MIALYTIQVYSIFNSLEYELLIVESYVKITYHKIEANRPRHVTESQNFVSEEWDYEEYALEEALVSVVIGHSDGRQCQQTQYKLTNKQTNRNNNQ